MTDNTVMTFHVYVQVEKKSGPDVQEDWVLDYFAGNLGRENGAGNRAYTFTVTDTEDVESVYEVVLVDDRDPRKTEVKNGA